MQVMRVGHGCRSWVQVTGGHQGADHECRSCMQAIYAGHECRPWVEVMCAGHVCRPSVCTRPADHGWGTQVAVLQGCT